MPAPGLFSKKKFPCEQFLQKFFSRKYVFFVLQFSSLCKFYYTVHFSLCAKVFECPISFKNRAVNNIGNYVMWWNSINVEELQA